MQTVFFLSYRKRILFPTSKPTEKFKSTQWLFYQKILEENNN